MRKLTAILCLTIYTLIGVVGVSANADSEKVKAALERGDFATVIREWKFRAKQGDTSAMYNLGLMHDRGDGVSQDYKAAAKWYRLAAKQGVAHAQTNLGIMYVLGQGVTRDYKTAVKLYSLAAEQGDASAQTNLGMMHQNGLGISQDYIRAHMWFDIAASSGKIRKASKNRDKIAKQMTPANITKAQDLARECVRKKFKGC